MSYVIAIDQGTTSTRALLFDADMKIVGQVQQEFDQHFPASGWVEHAPDDLLNTVIETCRAVLAQTGVSASDIAAIGITNQRETTLIWDKNTGRPIYRAIVWQDRRTAARCQELRDGGHGGLISETTGLLLDPYFSGTKLQWMLENVDGAQALAEQGKLLFGTVDSYLIWHLTGGKSHVTDATNAARTMLYDIHRGEWSAQICGLLNIPMDMLPEVKDCAADFGIVTADILGAQIPILGVAGDQHAGQMSIGYLLGEQAKYHV
ncbi:MAG: glycerol kinase, partial [Rhodobacteraceae bacterium]|nr:glycerol kinase [Paracoccaceae bacterium]